MKDLHKLTGVIGNLSTAYHPQTDGQTKHINQEVKQYLQLFVNHQQSDWFKWLSCTEFSYNDKVQNSMGFSPFFVNYGWHPYKGTNPHWQVKSQLALEFAEKMKKIHAETKAALTIAQETMKCNYNKKKGESWEYKIGDRVWLEGTNILTDWPIKKLDDKWHGPFTIVGKKGESAYWLQLPKTWKHIHPVFNEKFLTPSVPSQYPSQQPPKPTPPIIVPVVTISNWTQPLTCTDMSSMHCAVSHFSYASTYIPQFTKEKLIYRSHTSWHTHYQSCRTTSHPQTNCF